jgi:hypothetical protein
VNMLTKAFCKFIQRKRVFCENNASCLCYGQNVHMDSNGRIRLLCDKHTTTNKKEPCLKQP